MPRSPTPSASLTSHNRGHGQQDGTTTSSVGDRFRSRAARTFRGRARTRRDTRGTLAEATARGRRASTARAWRARAGGSEAVERAVGTRADAPSFGFSRSPTRPPARPPSPPPRRADAPAGPPPRRHRAR
ncbi:hypothetical protein FTX61_17755 [Nitriliruptoraceae bacterium ZYF776]|nr:hypothetical protein [Profundirhabdus halotolerans]